MKKEVKSKRVSIEELAERCGVSSMTASRAFRAGQSVSAATRQKVLKTAEEIGYQPQVRMGRPRHPRPIERSFVEVVLGMTVHSVFYSELLSSIERELASRGHDCVIRSVTGDFEVFVALCDVLRESPNTPTLLVGYLPVEQLRTLLEARPQTLLVDHTGDPGLDLPFSSIGFDNTEAARIAVRHLLKLGRNRILLINGFPEHYFSRDIELGYRETLTYAGVTASSDLILETDFTVESAVEKIDSALDGGLGFDAVFTGDEMAAGVLYALHRRGIRIPEDVAVAGCDGLPFGRYTVPPLTTVSLDYPRLGRMAVQYILDQKRPPEDHCRVRLLPRFELRESTQKTSNDLLEKQPTLTNKKREKNRE